MLELIEEMIEETYENIEIKVEYQDIREYGITVGIEKKGIIYETKFIYKWNYHLTNDVNLDNIKNIINKEIIMFYIKKGK